ncbi:tRNA-splicing endonuclease subunit Sen15 isoform X2 [Protopterus annectens]|uniref:tRNA-splicing endonuclease subunit Sen15 isoform X2 n=1 Tax=Protopterus annectens TaxID=7888 RepID=UPI001CFAA420|nr:tRNA-splicing endonuclease subunit Sen15 isoform X2 [Protopterus annectens]
MTYIKSLVSVDEFTEMMALDVGDDTQVYAAFLVYLDLLEARNWQYVEYVGSPELQIIYLQGCEKEGESFQVICPAPVPMSLSHERIKKIMNYTCYDEDSEENAVMSFILAVVESDSTIVYYRLTDGLVVPDPPDEIEDIDNKQWRKKRRKLLR